MDDRMFLDRLREDARDTLTRSAYADWLEERDDPRGEYLRKEIELSTVAVDDPAFPELARWVREREAMNAPEWVAEACPLWDAILLGYERDKKINVIMVIREMTSKGLKEAKDWSEALPANIVRGVPFHAAWIAADRLRGAAGEWPLAVQVEASIERRGQGWPEHLLPWWPHAVELVARIEGKRTELVTALRAARVEHGWMTAEEMADLSSPVRLKTFRMRIEAKAFAARFAGLAETAIKEASVMMDATSMSFDYWQR